MERRLAAILAADVVGYTRLMGADEAGTLRRLTELRQRVLDPLIARHHGRVFKLMGDGMLVEFSSVVDAVTCAVAWQIEVTKEEATADAATRLRFRIGINLGDVIVEGEDIHGDGVNIAARLEGLADTGGVCLSADVYRQVRGKIEAEFDDLGEQNFKNVAEPIRVYAIRPEKPLRKTPGESQEALSLPSKPSIAVLPFDNMSGDPEQEYFADGISEDIITALSSFRSIFVIARNSSFVYKGVATDVKQVGISLGVRYVLEGSVRKSTTRVRITAQLIDATSGVHLWAQRYDRTLEDVFELQDEITETIVAAIQPELEVAERERAHRKSPADLDAWDNCQRGMWHSYKFKAEETTRAEAYFNIALEIAPDYGPALAGLAYVDFQRVLLNFELEPPIPRDSLIERGIRRATAAVRTDDKDAFSQFVFGRLSSLKGQFDEAIKSLSRAIELNPNYAIAYHGLGYALVFSGKAADAVAQLDTALRLSPQDPYHWAFLTMRACALMMSKDYSSAVETGRLAIHEQPGVFWAYAHVTVALAYLERHDEASQALTALLAVKPEFSLTTIDETLRFKESTDREHYLAGLRKAGLRK